MEDERNEDVYDIGYGFRNPCSYLQQALNGFLRCLGLERSGGSGGGGGGDGGGGGGGGAIGDPSSDDPTDEPASATGLATRRTPPRGPISSGGPGQTN